MKKNDDKIAILITSFMRDDLLLKTINNILNNWNDNYYILIGNQGDCVYKEGIKKKIKGKGRWLDLPFDCGLSFARNELVLKANNLGYKYCFLSADSLHFTEKYNLKPCIDFFKKHHTRGIIGFHLNNSRGEWYGDLDLIEGNHFLISECKRDKIDDFQPVDIVKNFFLARTECLLDNSWDNELCLCEHEDFMYRLKKDTKWKVFYYPKIRGLHITERTGDYAKLRNRCYSEFVQKLKDKYKIKGWVKNTIPRGTYD